MVTSFPDVRFARRAPELNDGEMASHVDPLTDLMTREGLIECLDRRMAAQCAASAPAALILFDLDRFVTASDGLGPLVCDKLLKRVASRLRSIVPDAIALARISRESFAVLLNSMSEAMAIAERLRDFMGRPHALSGHAVTMSISIGLAVTQGDGTDASSVLHAASLALHQAQRDGGNRCRTFHSSMHDKAAVTHLLEADFRAAVALQKVELEHGLVSQQFEVHYQPVMSLHDGSITGFEALLRWRHPERGLVAPGRFIPLAEETGLIHLLGDWVLRIACRDAASWPIPKAGAPLRVAVNVSPLQLRDGHMLVRTIERALSESGLPAHRLEIEITETAQLDAVSETLDELRRLGLGLALDDFGMGYSSLSRLHRYPFTRLKIDRSFVANLDASDDEATQCAAKWMIRAIVSLGIGLGLETIIEGIESEHQREIARLAGCSEMQGYLVSRAVAACAVNDIILCVAQALPQKEQNHDD